MSRAEHDDEARSAALIDALDARRAAREAAPAGGDDDAELAALDQVRALYRAMPAEDPPPAISAQLLAAAAAARPARQRGVETGAFARLARWVEALGTPVLAAASLLLIAGVAGVLASRGGMDVVRPPPAPASSSSPAAASPAGTPASGSSPSAPPTAAAPTGTAGDSVTAPAAAPTSTVGGVAPRASAKGEASGGHDEGRALTTRDRKRAEAKPASPKRAQQAGSAADLDEGAAGAGALEADAEVAPTATRGAATKGRAPRSSKEDSAPSAPAADGSAAEPSDATGAAPLAPSSQDGGDADLLRRRALDAAVAGDCAAARRALAALRAVDPAGAAAVARDARVARCVPAP